MVSRDSFSNLRNPNKELISLQTLSDLVGHPVEFLKEELNIQEDVIPLEKLRPLVLDLLDITMNKVVKTN